MEKEYIAGEPQRYEIGNRVFIVEPRYDTAGRPLLYAGEMLDGSLLPLLPGCRSAQ